MEPTEVVSVEASDTGYESYLPAGRL